ncbi:MAG: hypothetical protein GY781_20815 [Gammaproteobacteria bacterium]|nr:hypothetical protein [Gammaproteobacteria bacterium]
MKTSNLSLDQAPPEDIPFRYLLTGPAFGILAGILLSVYGERIFITAWSLDTVALVHMITLGWLTLIMIGAFYQMVPVLVGGHVPWNHLSRINYYSLVSGILSLISGFLFWKIILLKSAAVLLLVSFSLFITQILTALFRVKANRPVVYAMRSSVICLALAVAAGITMIGVLFGWWGFPLDGYSLKYIHITFALLGWITLLIFGVSFHVIPMFYLTKAFPDRIGYSIVTLILLSIVSLVIGFGMKLNGTRLIVAGIPAFIGVILYVFTLFNLIRNRQRKMVDSTFRFWQLGLTCLIPALLLLTVDPFRWDEIFGYLFVITFLIGFACSVSNGMLYKIVPFLIWLHRFSPLVGKIKTPAMKDIIADAPARKQFYLFCLSFILIVVCCIFPVDSLIRIAGVSWSVSSIILFFLQIKAIKIQPPEVPKTTGMDDFAAMFKDLPPPPPK